MQQHRAQATAPADPAGVRNQPAAASDGTQAPTLAQMTRRNRCSVALVAMLAIGLAPAAGPSTAAAAVPTPPNTVDAWAWCGVNPDDPAATAAVTAMATAGGIDATFGPCNVPIEPYSPAFTSNRYVAPDVYMRLVKLNATVGMKTVVYDQRLWSLVAQDRNDAVAFWQPVLKDIAAWDMGDEFDPVGTEWNILKQRWALMRSDIEVRTGVKPFTNHLPTTAALDKALVDLPGVDRLLSFAKYDGDKGVGLAQAYTSKATLMCGVNTFNHFIFAPTPASIRADMDALKVAGCDQILVFGGFPVYATQNFGDFSVVDRTGAASGRAPATQEGSGHSVLIPVGPLRLLETRPGLATVDGEFNNVGLRPADSVLELGVVGRRQHAFVGPLGGAQPHRHRRHR